MARTAATAARQKVVTNCRTIASARVVSAQVNQGVSLFDDNDAQVLLMDY
jgi:hypothetical protein